MRNEKSLIVITLIGVLLATAGCRTFNRHIRNYDGPPLGTNQIALLKVEWSVSHVMLSVNKIDHQRVKRQYASEIELLPGPHELEVYYRDSSGYHSTTDGRIDFMAKAGTIYELRAAPLEMNLSQKIVKSFELFSHWRWTMWIIDDNTGKVIAGTPRETPLHWYE